MIYHAILRNSNLKDPFNTFTVNFSISGSISYEEFLLCLRGKSLNASREKFVIKAFEKLDKDNSGTITVNDLQGVYDVTNHPKVISGEWTEEKALTSFLG